MFLRPRDWRHTIPQGFWLAPASASGRFHPPGQTMWIHAVGTWRAARLAWRRVPWDDTREDQGMRKAFLTAAFFHDIGKGVSRHDHEQAGAEMLLPRSPLAAFFVLRHSGRWGPSWEQCRAWLAQRGLQDLDTERNRWLCDLLAGCDYVDAYRHIIWKEV